MSFSTVDEIVFVSLFILSVLYALVLQWWNGHYPESFDDNTWLTVVIGVGYVLLGLFFVLSVESWLRVCAAFFFASLPIIARSLVNAAHRRRAANRHVEDLGHDQA